MKESNKTFTFQHVSTDKVDSIIKKLNTSKASKSDDITNKVFKEFETFFANFLFKILTSTVALRLVLSLKSEDLFPFTR